MFFQYLSNKAETKDRSMGVQFIVIKTLFFDCWCDKGELNVLWQDIRCRRKIEID